MVSPVQSGAMLFAGSKLWLGSLPSVCGNVLSTLVMLATGTLLTPALAQQAKPVPAQAPVRISAQTATQTPSQIGTAAATAPTAAEQRHAQQVQELINRAQASYTAGVNDYNNDHLDAARADFDSAVDTMLLSGMEISSDPQLSDAFEHLLDSWL